MPAAMEEGHRSRPHHWSSLVLRDVQFWIPVAVLCGGLLALGWIS
jgi:hypothetical protein